MALLCGIQNIIYLLNRSAVAFNPFKANISSISVSSDYTFQIENIIKNIYF